MRPSLDAEKEPLVLDEDNHVRSSSSRDSSECDDETIALDQDRPHIDNHNDAKQSYRSKEEAAYHHITIPAEPLYIPKSRPWTQAQRWLSRHPFLAIGATCGTLLILTIIILIHIFSAVNTAPHTDDNISDVFNSTLGFQKVIAISFEDRTKRQDALTMGAALTGVEVEFSPGVWGTDIPMQDTPSTWNWDKWTAAQLGCWRAHMNAVRRVVTERLGSALILEDDADWDWFLKQQLVEAAKASRWVTGSDGQPSTHVTSPYGDDWDILWLGNCGAQINHNATHYYVVNNDISAGPEPYLMKHLNPSPLPLPEWGQNNTRWFFLANGGVCMTGYAVSYRGAQKLLTTLSLQSISEPYDDMVHDFCHNKLGVPAKCVTVHPPMIQMHRHAGPKSANSDIAHSTSDAWHDEYTFGIKYSAIMNAKRLVGGETTVKAQWPDATDQEIEIGRDLKLNGEWKSRPNRIMKRAREFLVGLFGGESLEA